jgi:MFS family permease
MGMGIFTLAYLLGGAFGPTLTGRLIDLNMSYGMVYISLAAIGLLSFLLTFSVRETNDKVDNSAAYAKKK